MKRDWPIAYATDLLFVRFLSPCSLYSQMEGSQLDSHKFPLKDLSASRGSEGLVLWHALCLEVGTPGSGEQFMGS